MKYFSVCSGIEAATVAWHSLGWNPIAFSEIEPFPCKVLAHHYQTVPNHGDMTKFKEWPDYANVDVLVGGTPCQSFSIAGLRKGLADPRGNLMLTYLAIAAKYRPNWILWENVPGVLSSDGGRDFASFLAGLEQCGYGFAYRVLDAQYCRTHEYAGAVPQRRRRVFVVGHLGNWRRAAAVLFDSESLRGNPPPSREKGKEVTGTIKGGSGSRGYPDPSDGNGGGLVMGGTCSGKPTFGTIMANCGQKQWLGNQEALSGDYHVFALAGNTIGRKPENGGNGTGFDETGAGYTLTKTDSHAVAHTFKIRGGCEGGGKGYLGQDEAAFTLSTGHDQDVMTPAMQVRRLTPLECERLQGFPDNYTNIPGASDSARYKALGNSMAVNVMQLIGQRIQMVEAIA